MRNVNNNYVSCGNRPGWIPASVLLAHTYDQNGNLLRMTEGSANYVYTYDNYGNILTETVPYATTVLQRGYDTLLRSSGLTYGTDYQVGYTYDGASRLSTVTAFGHSATYTRMAGANRLTATAFANGNTPVHTANRSYDDFNRLTAINGYGYTLNDNDQRTRLTLPDTDLWDYTYDGLGQVTGGVKKDDEETPLATHAYTYDQIGNRITATQDLTVTNYTSNLLNQYTAIDAELPTYDFDGNMLTNNGWTYTWNIENRLTTAETATTKLEFAYDYMGRRTTKKFYTKVNDAWTLQWTKTFVYDGFKQIAEYTGTAVTMYTVWQPAASGDYDVPLWTKTGTNVQTYITDGNKNIRQLKDAAGVVIANYDYDPFGNVTATGTTTPWQFSSEYRDTETALVYYNYRYYDPRLGRWTKRDPIGEDGGMNLYLLGNNRPVDLYDSLGEEITLLKELREKENLHRAMLTDETFANIKQQLGLDSDAFGDLNPEWDMTQEVGISGCANIMLDTGDDYDLEQLSLIAYSEGTSDSYDDKHAVATVIINRIDFNKVDHKMYHSNVTDVIQQSRQFAAYNGVKWRKGSRRDFTTVAEYREWNWSVDASLKVVRQMGGKFKAIGKATVFHSDAATGNRPMERTIGKDWEWEFKAKVGKHYYFEIFPKRK